MTRTIIIGSNNSSIGSNSSGNVADTYTMNETEQLEDALQTIEHTINSGERVLLVLKVHAERRRRGQDGRFQVKSRTVKVGFPSMDSDENRRFVWYVRLFEKAVKLTNMGKTSTKRKIYYDDVTLYKKQRIVNEYVDTIADALDTSIESLGVVASQKGLIYANLDVLFGGQSWQLRKTSGVQLMPQISLNAAVEDVEFNGEVDRIIIVEKDAVLNEIYSDYNNNGTVLVTGRGFPDRTTKKVLSLLTNRYPSATVAAYVDSDCYGLNIYKQYKRRATMVMYGRTQPAVERLRYAGVRLLGGASELEGRVKVEYLPLKALDAVRTQQMLIKEHEEEEEGDEDIKRELQRGLFCLAKREMDAKEVTEDATKDRLLI